MTEKTVTVMPATFHPCIDISKWQGIMNVAKAKLAGINMFYARALYGTREDERFKEYCTQFRANNVQFGIYIWFRPALSARSQAAALIKLHRESGATLIPMLDIEDASGLPPVIVRARVEKMVKLVTASIGKHPTIYTGHPFWTTHVKSDKLGRCPLWLARYPINTPTGYQRFPVPIDPARWAAWAGQFNREPVVPEGWKVWCAWQFSAGNNRRGRTYGASSGDLDLNIMRASQLDRFRLP